MTPDVRDGVLVGSGLIIGALGGAFAIRGFDWAAGGRREDDRREQEPAAPAPPARGDAGAPRPAAVVWFGPVSRAQIAGASLGNLPLFVRSCTGDGKPSCSAIADSWKDADGRRLPGLRRALRLPAGPLVLAAFSAGGHLVWRLLEHPLDRAEVAGVALADATYTTRWVSQGEAAPIASLVAYAQEVARDPSRLFLATASTAPNKTHPTGAQTLEAIVRAAELRPLEALPRLGNVPAPARSWGGGRTVLFLDFAATRSHAEHATDLAPALWGSFVKPRFQGAAA